MIPFFKCYHAMNPFVNPDNCINQSRRDILVTVQTIILVDRFHACMKVCLPKNARWAFYD